MWGSRHPSSKERQETALGKKEKGNLWALAAVGTGAAGWGTGGEESLAQRELALSPPSTTTFPLRGHALDGLLCHSLLPALAQAHRWQKMDGAQKVSTWVPLGIGCISGSRDHDWQP